MGISGSDLAYKQARAGIARAGASRLNYFTPNVAITIGGTDRSSYILAGSMRITLVLNDEPDTARFTVKPNAVFAPTAGQPVVIGLGTAANREFAGQVSRVTHRRRRGNETPWIDVTCVDWLRLFDRRTITTEWLSTSASEIVADIVNTYTSGFTTNYVVSGLDTIDYFPATNAKPSDLLRRLAALIGGAFYIDPDRDVHFFGSAGETGLTAPATLTNSLTSLKSFQHSYDASQIRTRVIVEGQRTTCPIPIIREGFPSLSASGYYEIPVLDPSMFTTYPVRARARLGTQRFEYDGTLYSAENTLGNSTITTAAASAGDTSIFVDSFSGSADVWCRIQDQYIYFGSTNNDFGPELNQIPASGLGSITGEIAEGAQVTFLPSLIQIEPTAFDHDQPKDQEVVIYTQTSDGSSELAAIEGGDGIHEHVISDHRLNYAGCAERGAIEIAAFKAALIDAEWETEDMNAKPGRPQVINLTTTDALSTTLTITRVALSFPVPNRRPRRLCQASTVKTARLLDVVGTETD